MRCTQVQGVGLFAYALLLLVLLGPGGRPGAAEVSGLYQAQAPVTDQGAAQRKRAMSEAFGAVVLKVTGRRDAQSAAGRADASRFVQQFRYLVDQTSDGQTGGLALLVQFDKNAVDAWLREQGLVVWGGSRPTTLLWLALERDGRRELFVPDLDQGTAGLIKGAADARGISVVFPLADLEDRSRMSGGELWGDRPEAARAASQRYQPDLVLTARVSQAREGRWVGQWTLVQGDRVDRWRTEEPGLSTVLTSGLGRMADKLATRFVPTAASVSVGALGVRVSNVLAFSDYLRLRAHLESVEGVRSVALQRLEPDAAVFRLTADADQGTLTRSLLIGGVLTQAPIVAAAAPGADDASVLQYRLSP